LDASVLLEMVVEGERSRDTTRIEDGERDGVAQGPCRRIAPATPSRVAPLLEERAQPATLPSAAIDARSFAQACGPGGRELRPRRSSWWSSAAGLKRSHAPPERRTYGLSRRHPASPGSRSSPRERCESPIENGVLVARTGGVAAPTTGAGEAEHGMVERKRRKPPRIAATRALANRACRDESSPTPAHAREVTALNQPPPPGGLLANIQL